MRHRHRVLFLILCIAGIAFLTLSTAGCLGGLFAKAYNVSGRVTDKDHPTVGVAGAQLSLGKFGTAMTDADGNWTKGNLKGEVTISIAKEGWNFSPASKKVTGAASNVDFEGTRFLDYMGLAEGVVWEYTLSFEYTGLPDTSASQQVQVRQSVVNVEDQAARTLFYILSEEDEPILPRSIDLKSFAATIAESEYDQIMSRKGDNYYTLASPEAEEDEEHLALAAPLRRGDTFMELNVEKQESITVEADTYNAWYCARASDDGTEHTEDKAWFAPFVGLVKATSEITDSAYPGMAIRIQLELTSYTKP